MSYRLGTFIPLLALAASLFYTSSGVTKEPAARTVVLIRFEGEINPFREAYFNRKLAKAEELGADVVIAEIDSPGGYIESSLNLATTLRDVDWATTVAYIPREGLSGAAIMALGSDQIVMGRNGRIGDAGPIFMGDDFLFRHAPEKIRSDLVRQVRDLADATGRPPALAEAMVDMDLVVYEVTHADTNEKTYKSDAELESLDDPTEWKKGPPVLESKKGLFLEVNGEQATKLGLAKGTVESRAALAAQFGKELNELIILETTWVDTVVMVLNSWPVTGLLFVVGLIALYVEFAAPGTGVGGLIAGLCFALFFWSRFLGGTAGWLEVVLFASGIIFLLMELFVIPGFGVAGISGIVLLMTSVVMASQRFTGADGLSVGDLSQSVLLLLGAGVAAVLGMVFLSKHFGSMPLFKHLLLRPPTPLATAAAGAPAVASLTDAGPSEIGEMPVALGDEGTADSALRPAGRVLFGEHYRDVVTDGSFVDKGARVRVIKVSGTHITVREIT